MANQWDTSASLLLDGRFPVHGTVAHCLDAWRNAAPPVQKTARLLVEQAIAASPGDKPAYSFEGDALKQLAEAVPAAG